VSPLRVEDWEIIADRLSKAGWSWGCVSALDAHWRTIWIVDAHRDDGKRFVVHADELLTALLELQSAIHTASDSPENSGQSQDRLESFTERARSEILRPKTEHF
jgi:hypothetical protein